MKISEDPFIQILPSDEIWERLDTSFYKPELRKITKLIENISDIVRLETIIRNDAPISSGATPKGAQYLEEGIPFLRVQNIRPMSITFEDIVFINKETHDELQRSCVIDGDVLLTITGATFGYAAVYRTERFSSANVNQHIARIRIDTTKAIPEFVALFLNSSLGYGQSLRYSTGGSRPALDFGSIKNFWIPCLDKKEQQEILDRYRKIELIINGNSSIVNVSKSKINHLKLTEHKKIWNRIDNAFSIELNINDFPESKRELVFIKDAKNCERLDIQANHPDYSKLVSQIRKSANSGSLSDLVEVSEKRFDPDEHSGELVNYLAIGDIDGMSGKIIEQQIMLSDELPSRARRLVCEGDILVGIAGASTGTENMVVFPVTGLQSGWVATTGFLVLQPKKNVDINYVCSLLKSPFVLRQIRALLVSPAMPTISESDLLAIMVPVTNLETRKKTLLAIENILTEGQKLTVQLEDLGNQIEEFIAKARSNILDLLDDSKFSAMSSRAYEIQKVMTQFEEVLQ